LNELVGQQYVACIFVYTDQNERSANKPSHLQITLEIKDNIYLINNSSYYFVNVYSDIT